MSETTTQTEDGQEATEVEQTEQTTTETPAAESTEAAQESKTDDLPDWARKQLTKANNEAAKYRTRVTELNDKLKGLEDSSGKVEDLSKQVTDTSAEADTAKLALLKLQIALSVEGVEAKNASDFAELLQGSTEEDLKAHAEKVKKLFGASRSPAVDPSLGRGGDVKPNPGTGQNRLAFAYSKKT